MKVKQARAAIIEALEQAGALGLEGRADPPGSGS